MRGKPLKERVGEKYGFIEIIDFGYREYSKGSKRKRGTLIFKCVCGNVKEVLAHNIIQGRVSSCGCKESYLKAKASTKHGLHKERIYTTYHDMKDRCKNPNNSHYHRYGGRGIKVCEEWKEDFMNFYNWAMKNGYDEHLTIERIDNDGNYEPSNCKWATIQEQLKNRNLSNCKNNGIKRPIRQIDKITNETICVFESIKEASHKTGFKTIPNVLAGRRKTSGGFKWEYSKEEEIVK